MTVKLNAVLLSKGAGGEHLVDEVDIDPRLIELHDGTVVEVLEKVDFGVMSL